MDGQSSHDAAAGQRPSATHGVRSPVVTALVVLIGVSMLIPGFWSWLAPASFARLVDFPPHEHYLHDLGVFQIGIGVTVLATLVWHDALTVALVGFLTANTLHAFNHAIDLDQGGHVGDGIALAALSACAAIALYLRLRSSGARKQEMP